MDWRVRKDGTRFWAMAVLDAVYDDDRNLIGYAKVNATLPTVFRLGNA